ncbi:kinase-like domain-containing protein [Fusarium circinatum]|uniref:Kinase-like domain-containing protein n=1 Tax=Fusarium circinatum TaxID=48490 RepID=A0A8H5T2G0_FUSCI|nr:kinase-like domain-containing protein [Fusarium circinatum]
MIFYDGQEELDNLVWDKNDEDSEAAQNQLRLKTFCRQVEEFVQHRFGKPATLISPLIFGGFNVLYRVQVEEMSPDVMIRLPCPSLVQFPGEKTMYEAATACLVAQETKLPVPRHLHFGQDSVLANIPRCILPPESQTYTVADEWYTVLAEMHIAQLVFQHNDLVTSEDDCRNKYVSRQIFRRLARNGQLSTFGFSEDTWSSQSSRILPETLSPCPSNSGPFRLWGDDFRAGNILLDDSDKIAALIDWEYTYAGPTQFILDPPWWLLLETAEMWSPDLEDWKQTYESRLGTWLSAMEKAEASMAAYNTFPVPLSSWAFDAVYWNFLDERFFGDRDPGVVKGDLWKTRIDLLSDDERAAMEPFVQRKMAEGKERLDGHYKSGELTAGKGTILQVPED